MRQKIIFYISYLLRTMLCLFLLLQAVIFGQSSATDGSQKNPKLQITLSESKEISLSAVKADTNQLAAELSRQLKIPVVLSGLMSDKTVNLTFYKMPLEEAARSLAPHARIDYVLMQKSTGTLISRPLAIYLSGYNEPEPTTAQSIGTQSQTIVIEGDTETLDETARNKNLKINFADNRLTLFARRQNLSFVISEIAARANLEFDLRFDTDKLIDIEIQNEPLVDALVRLSPHVRVYLRKDLLTNSTTAFRVALTKSDYLNTITR